MPSRDTTRGDSPRNKRIIKKNQERLEVYNSDGIVPNRFRLSIPTPARDIQAHLYTELINTHCQQASVAPHKSSERVIPNRCSHNAVFRLLWSFSLLRSLFPLLLWLSVHDGQIRGCNPSVTHHMAWPCCHRCSDWTSMPL